MLRAGPACIGQGGERRAGDRARWRFSLTADSASGSCGHAVVPVAGAFVAVRFHRCMLMACDASRTDRGGANLPEFQNPRRSPAP